MASVVDRLQAAKYTVTGNDVSKIVAKATTHEMGSPKRKHLDFLIQCTHSPNVSLPECADMLLARVQDPSWIVSIKAMMSLHHLMNDGSEKFMRYMASKGNNFEFISEKTGPMSMEMYSFIKRYGHYLSEKCTAYLQATVDFNRVSNTNFLRQATTEKLLTYLPILQRQVDGLINLDMNSGDLCTEINRGAFILLYRDLIGLFKIYNEGVIGLLETFFEMEKKHAREAFDLYCKFVNRMEKVEKFFKVAEDAGIDEGDVPDLSKAPSSLKLALENHLKSLENKGTPISSPTEMARSPPAPPKSGTAKADPFSAPAAQKDNPFGDSFAPQQDLLADPMLLNATPPAPQPRTDFDELNDLLAAPKAQPNSVPLIHNNESVLVESSFNPFGSSFGTPELFPSQGSTLSPTNNNNVIDLLSDPIPEQTGSSFAQFQNEHQEPDFLVPDRPNQPTISTGSSVPTSTHNVTSLMQDLDIGLKNAAANFSLSSPNKSLPAQGPVRPISSGTTYNPFIRPGYPSGMMQPMYGMQSNMTMPANMGMANNPMGMQAGYGMQPPMGSNTMGMRPGMAPMQNTMASMPNNMMPQARPNNFTASQNNFDPFS